MWQQFGGKPTKDAREMLICRQTVGIILLAAQVDGLLRVPVVYSSEQWGGTADSSLHPGRGGEKTVTTRTAGK